MAVLTLLASGVNYASNLLFSRLLSRASFGEFSVLLAVSVLVAIPTAAAQTVIAERVAAYRAAGRMDIVQYLVRHAFAHVATIGVVVGFIYTLAIPLVVKVLDLQHPGPAIALAPLIVLTFIFPVVLAVLQGMERFVAFGAVFLAVALARIGFGVPWAMAGGGAGGAIGGQAVGMALVIVAAAVFLRPHMTRRGRGAATSGIRRRIDVRAVAASAAFIIFALVSNLDLLLAKLFLSRDQVGTYAALATVGKVVTFLPGAVAIAMVPSAARAGSDGAVRSRVLRTSALLVLLTTLVVAIPAALEPRLVIESMFGSKYLGAVDGVRPIVLAGVALSMLNLLVVYSVAIRDRRWVLVLVLGVAVQIVGIGTFHASPAQVATVQAVAVTSVLIANEVAFHSLLRVPRGRPSG